MAKKRPAYQWYPKDYDSDEVVRCMTYEQEGVYHRLLDHQWVEGSLPADPKRIALLVPKQMTVDHFVNDIWPAMAEKFIAREDGRLINRRLERHRAELDAYAEAAAVAGRASAAAKRANGRSTDPQPEANGTSTDGQRTVNGTATIPQRNTNSSSSYSGLRTSDSDLQSSKSSQPTAKGRGRQYGRIYVHQWMQHKLIDMLGPHAPTFALDEWVDSLSARSMSEGLVFEKEADVWNWIKAEFRSEIQRRGLPVAKVAPPDQNDGIPQLGKTNTRLMAAISQLRN